MDEKSLNIDEVRNLFLVEGDHVDFCGISGGTARFIDSSPPRFGCPVRHDFPLARETIEALLMSDELRPVYQAETGFAEEMFGKLPANLQNAYGVLTTALDEMNPVFHVAYASKFEKAQRPLPVMGDGTKIGLPTAPKMPAPTQGD